MGKRLNREKYANKIIQEFIDKGFDLQKAFGQKGSVNSVSRSEKTFNDFKRKVRETRSYYKEREQIARERAVYKEKLEKKNDDFKKQKLVDLYGEKAIENGTIKQIWDKKEDYGLKTLNDFRSKSKIQNAIVNEWRNIFEDEVMETSKGKVGAFFKHHAEEGFVQPYLEELYSLAKNDLNAIKNLNETYNYIYQKIIPMKYPTKGESGGDGQTYSNIKKADEQFWEDSAKKILDHYKTLNIRNK